MIVSSFADNSRPSIPYFVMQGGTSRALFFDGADLPDDLELRNSLLLNILRQPALRKYYGMGDSSLTSKIAIISPSKDPSYDVDYFFVQADLTRGLAETGVSCGNILSAVGLYAVGLGLVKAAGPQTIIRVKSLNTGGCSELTVETHQGLGSISRDSDLFGLCGLVFEVAVKFLNPEGSNTGRILPTGRPWDHISGLRVSCIDSAMPVVIARAADLDVTGYEHPDALNTHSTLLSRLETLRQEAGVRMGLGDVSRRVVPKIALVAPPRQGGTICSRYFTPFVTHTSYAVSGALSLAAACLIPGTVAADMVPALALQDQRIVIEHPAGMMAACITIRNDEAGIRIPYASFGLAASFLGEGQYDEHGAV